MEFYRSQIVLPVEFENDWFVESASATRRTSAWPTRLGRAPDCDDESFPDQVHVDRNRLRPPITVHPDERGTFAELIDLMANTLEGHVASLCPNCTRHAGMNLSCGVVGLASPLSECPLFDPSV